ncbi:MAG: hypothetical protein AABO41_09285 [Acidobacteriota bacterium]
MICHHCKNEVKLEAPVARADECPHCAADLHCCLNCLHYDPSMSNRCREPQAEWVSDREKANFCDFFTPNKSASAGGLNKPATSTRDAFDSLFKK